MSKLLKKLILSNRVTSIIAFKVNHYILKSRKKVIIGRKSKIGISTICEGNNRFGSHCTITSSFIGFASYISDNSKISNTKIGRYSSIGPNVDIILGKHPSHTFVSTHPAFFSKNKLVGFTYAKEQLFNEYAQKIYPDSNYSVLIGNDVWIGANVKIMDGVKIGDGSIIAAGSIVVKDVPAFSIVGGVPSKIIKMRFNSEQIQFLKEFEWWNKKQDWISTNSSKFTNINEFIMKFKFDE